jgi:hypothetical protein
MLNILAIIGVIVVIGVAGVLIYAATLPKEYSVSRSASIDAPPEKIFPLINDIKNFNEWNPFAKQDPTIVISYNGPQSGKGAAYSWDSKGKAGKGSLAITDAASPSRVNLRLDMEKPMKGSRNRGDLDHGGAASLYQSDFQHDFQHGQDDRRHLRRWPFRLEGTRGKIGGIRELLRLTANTERKEKP